MLHRRLTEDEVEPNEIRQAVRERYGSKAVEEEGCCAPSCCSPESAAAEEISRQVGYDEAEMAKVPEGANLGLGCGNPVALAALEAGQTVLDLGSGAGFDCFLAADRVGPRGKVIGVDMTPQMVERARANKAKGDFGNVDFRLGEIEALPVGDGLVDVVISNCVLNLSADRRGALGEAYRVLKPGGRLMISDLVSSRPVPEFVAESKEALVGCLPVPVDDYLADLTSVGFVDVEIEQGQPYPSEHLYSDPQVEAVLRAHPERTPEVREFVESIHGGTVRATKPGA